MLHENKGRNVRGLYLTQHLKSICEKLMVFGLVSVSGREKTWHFQTSSQHEGFMERVFLRKRNKLSDITVEGARVHTHQRLRHHRFQTYPRVTPTTTHCDLT